MIGKVKDVAGARRSPRPSSARATAPSAWVLALAVLLGACGGQVAVPTTAAPPATSPPAPSRLEVEGPGRYDGEVLSEGRRRYFVLVVPESAPPPAPVVIVFHGFMGNAREVEELTGMTTVAEEEGFLVVYPEGAGLPRSWRSDPRRGDRDVVFVRELVGLLADAVEIDEERIYVAGMSNGGGMAARLACDASDLVAAAGAVAAAYPVGECAPGRPVPVVAFHGTADPIVPYEGWGLLLPSVEDWARGWAGRNGCAADPVEEAVAPDVARVAWGDCEAGADVTLYTVEGGRHGWPGAGRHTFWGGSTDSVDASALLWQFFVAHPMP